MKTMFISGETPGGLKMGKMGSADVSQQTHTHGSPPAVSMETSFCACVCVCVSECVRMCVCVIHSITYIFI